MIKAACHVHSDWSYDGKWSVENLAVAFKERGYQVVLMTEHDKGFTEERRLEHREACARASSKEILVVPGIEYSDAKNIVHILVWGPVPFLGEGVPTLELLKKVAETNGVAVLAHPSRKNAWQCFSPEWSNHLLGIEVWNRKTDGWAPSPDATPLFQGNSLLQFVGLDFHAQNQFFPLAMELDLTSGVDENSVLECLRGRRCRGTAFGSPIQEVMDGWFRFTLNSAERCRRSASVAYRSLKKHAAGR